MGRSDWGGLLSQMMDGTTSQVLSVKMPDWLSTPMVRKSASRLTQSRALMPIQVGCELETDRTVDNQCEGLLDEVALFSVPLEQDDIKEIMEEGLEGATGLLAVEPQK